MSNLKSSVLPNSAQSLSDPQQSLLENITYPADWNESNPVLTPSPFPWSGSYTSPNWAGSYGQHGNGNDSFVHSNQFNSAVSQPLNLNTYWEGKEHVPTSRNLGQFGGMTDFWKGRDYTPDLSQMVLQNKGKIPSQKVGAGKKAKRK